LEAAARQGQAIPGWIEEIIRTAGREHYHRLRGPADLQQSEQDDTHGGVTGFQDVGEQERSISFEMFWAVGKQYGYPRVAELGLESGKMAWNRFTLTCRRLMPDVVARLGGLSGTSKLHKSAREASS
jgi:hypothetical protein